MVMHASPDEARLLFHKWSESSTAVRIRLMDSLVIFDGVGMVAAFGDSALELAGDSWQLTVPLSGAAFALSDPREIPVASVRERESEQYELGLAVDLARGGRVVLMELK
jgi:hypothetical protein